MSRRKPHTKRFNQRYGSRIRTDLQQKKNEAVLRAAAAEDGAKPKKGAAKTSAA
jgi:hypothetical protein